MITFLDKFFFRPASARPLAVIRIGIALILLAQAMMCASLFFEWYGTAGILQNDIGEQFSTWGVPHTTQIIRLTAHLGMSERTTLEGLAALYVISLLALLIGFRTRSATFLSWLTHLIFAKGHFTAYGVDLFAHITLFYGIFMPLGGVLSVDSLIKGPLSPSWTARLSLRVLQLHLCLVYFATGIEKSLGIQWRNGEAIWRSLMLPTYRHYDWGVIANVPWLALLLCWGTLIVEIGYPFFIFPRKTRPLWVLLVVSLHAGIAVFLGLHLFAALMALLTFSCFGLSPDPGAAIIPIPLRALTWMRPAERPLPS